MRAFGQTAKWKKEEGKTLAIKKGAFWPIARLQQLAKEGKEKRRLKGGLEGQIILTATIEPAAYSGDCGAATAVAPGYMAE